MIESIRLLGSVEVATDQGVTRVGGDIPRAVLTRLAWTPRDLVSTDQLIADVWTHAPDAAGATLRAHLSRLRKAGLGSAVVGVRGGYLLDLERTRVDAVDVLDRVRALGAPRADQEHLVELERLFTLLDEDLAAGLEGPPFLVAARARWADARRVTEEDLGETALALGDQATAIAVLERTVGRHPDHERPVRLLATALARQTRFTDALDVLDEFAAHLRDTQGLEVSRRVAGLRVSIVRLEPAVVAPATGAAVTRVGVQMPLTRFVGRAGVLAELRRARRAERLITLVGPAGVGKTRTAVELAREATTALDEEQYMVDLADVRDPRAVELAIANAVRAPEASVAAIATRLAERRVLVVLDNADHVLGAVAVATAGLLKAAPDLRLLVTSREALRLDSEHEVQLRPFGPDETADAWRLFAERAADARGGDPFGPDEEDAARSLCADLDGTPLALELTAARLDVLDVPAVRAGLDAWSGEGRHASVASAIAWSFDLLDADLQRALIHAGRFAGPFTVEAFAGIEGVSKESAEALLAALVDKSLLSAERSDTARPRLRMLESMREFVARRDADGSAAAWARAHRAWFADLVWTLGPTLRSFRARDTMAVLDGFGADLDAAMDAAVVAGDRDAALLLTGGLAHYWYLRGRFSEGRTRLDQALSLVGDGVGDGTHGGAGIDDPDAARALPLAELELANLAYQLGDAPAGFVAIAGAIAHGQAVGDASSTAVALGRAAYGRSIFGEQAESARLIAAASHLAPGAAPWAQSEVLHCEGQMLRGAGESEAALAAATGSLAIARTIGYTWMITSSEYLTAKILLDARRPREAIGVGAAAADWAYRAEDAAAGLALVHVVAGACAAVERHEIGARLFGAVDALGVRYGYSTAAAEGEDALRLRHAVSAGLPAGEYEREYRNGRGLAWNDVMDLIGRLPQTPPDRGDAVARPTGEPPVTAGATAR